MFSGWYNCFCAINVGILQNFGRTSSTRRTPIPRPDGWAMGVIPVSCWEKWPWDIRSGLYRGVYRRILCLVFFLRRRGLMYNRYQCRSRDSAWLLVFRSRDICWYRMDIDHWMLVQVETKCIQWETMTPDLSVWIHDIASNASPHTPCAMLRRFVVPEIAQNCKWFCSLFEVIWLLLLLSIRCCL